MSASKEIPYSYLSESPTRHLKAEEEETPTNSFYYPSKPIERRESEMTLPSTEINIRQIRSMSNAEFSSISGEDIIEQILEDFKKNNNVEKVSAKLFKMVVKDKKNLDVVVINFCKFYQQLKLDKYKKKCCNYLVEFNNRELLLRIYRKLEEDKALSKVICKKYEKHPDVLDNIIFSLAEEDLQIMPKVVRFTFREKECSAFLLGHYLRRQLKALLKKIRINLESKISDPSKYDLHPKEEQELERNRKNFISIVEKTFSFLERIQFNESIRTLINKMVTLVQTNVKNTSLFSEEIIKSILISNVLFSRCICNFFGDAQKHLISTGKKEKMDVVLRNIFKVVQICASNEPFSESNDLYFMNPLIPGYHKSIEGFALKILTPPEEKKKK